MKKHKKIKRALALITSITIGVSMWGGITAFAKENQNGGYTKHFDVTDTDYVAGDKLELNSINDNLRQAVNDTCQNYVGCQVTFMIKQKTFVDTWANPSARLTGNGYSFMSQTVNIVGNYIVFDFDCVNHNHVLWGHICDLTFDATVNLTITDIYVYVPPQKSFGELSAGECAYQNNSTLE